jgi:hypothetical protein
MYFLAKSYYVNMSWAQQKIAKALSSFINEETKAKMLFSGESTHPEIT